MVDNIYFPETIENQPLPETGEQEYRASSGTPSNKSISSPDSFSVGAAFPTDIHVGEFISQSFDTQSKKILGNYTFGASGALAIGNFESGVTGDIKLSPTGILGRNAAGDTTFSIDATTGDATFKGTVAAGSVVTGYLIVGGAAADVNAGTTTISGGKITTNTIAADRIITGQLVVGTNVGIGTAEDSAGVTTIIGNVVTTGYVNALSVVAGSVSADDITAGTINAVTITGTTITGGTLTGATIKTKSSGARVQLNANEAWVSMYDAGNDLVFLLDEDGSAVLLATSDGRDLILGADDGLGLFGDVNVVIEATAGTLYLEGGAGIYVTSDITTTGKVDVGGDLYVDDIYDSSQGFVEIHDGLYISDDMTIDDGVWIGGDLDVQGDKDFLIPHPDGSNRLLKYSSVESPEVALSCRGIGRVSESGEVRITPPDHFVLVTEPEGLVTVDLTPIGDNPIHLKELPGHSGFTVGGAPETQFTWRLTAIREGRLNNEVEVDLNDPNSKKAKKWVEQAEWHSKSRNKKSRGKNA